MSLEAPPALFAQSIVKLKSAYHTTSMRSYLCLPLLLCRPPSLLLFLVHLCLTSLPLWTSRLLCVCVHGLHLNGVCIHSKCGCTHIGQNGHSRQCQVAQDSTRPHNNFTTTSNNGWSRQTLNCRRAFQIPLCTKEWLLCLRERAGRYQLRAQLTDLLCP